MLIKVYYKTVFLCSKVFFVTQARFSRFFDLLYELKVIVYRPAGKKNSFLPEAHKLRLKKKTWRTILVLQKIWCAPRAKWAFWPRVVAVKTRKLHTWSKKAHFAPLVHNILFEYCVIYRTGKNLLQTCTSIFFFILIITDLDEIFRRIAHISRNFYENGWVWSLKS